MSWFGLGGGKKDDAGGAGQASTYDFAAGNATAFSEDPGGAAFDGGANLGELRAACFCPDVVDRSN